MAEHDLYGLSVGGWPAAADPGAWRRLPDPGDDDRDDDEDEPITQDVLDLLGFDPDEEEDEDELPTEVLGNAFCATGPGGGIDPTCSPGDILHTAKHAAGRNDQAVLGHVRELVRQAGQGRAARGTLGVAGMRELAKGLGLKGHSGLKKAGLSQLLQDHFAKLARGGGKPSDLDDRLERLGLAEKYTGIKHEDRVVNGVLAQLPLGRAAEYRAALADVARHGPNAKAEHVSHLKNVRAQVRRELKAGQHDRLLEHALEGVAENGHGNLSPAEFKARLAGGDKGLRAAAREAAAPATAGGAKAIVPDDLTLKPAPRRRKTATKAPAPPPDYADRLREPLADRLKDVKHIEQQSGVPFSVRVIHALLTDPKVRIDGSADYLHRADREAGGERLTAEERRKQSGFRAKAVAAIKFGDVTPHQLVRALEAVDGERRGTLRWDEFVDTLKKVSQTRNAVLGGVPNGRPGPPAWYQDLLANADGADPDPEEDPTDGDTDEGP